MSGQKGIGERIRRLRRQQGLSQRDLAARIGTNGSQLSKYETGLTDPRPLVLGRIAGALETTTDFLITGIHPGAGRDARLRSLLPVLEQLPGELRGRLADFLENLIQAHHLFRLGRRSPSERV